MLSSGNQWSVPNFFFFFFFFFFLNILYLKNLNIKKPNWFSVCPLNALQIYTCMSFAKTDLSFFKNIF